ncbi:CBS domain-containing protein [Chloroflexi bacterium TSY]|nr:CBS domain-containing protein [Chloroflexi bacterium TSY]
MKARELMTTPAITVTADKPIGELAAIMQKNHISGVPVVDNQGKLLGIVTELHLIARNAPIIGPSYISLLAGLIPVELQQYRRYREQVRQVLATTAGELMSEQVKYITPDADLETIIGMMEEPEIIQLPVIEEKKVIGVITRTDVVRLIEKLEMAPDTSEAPEQ